MIAMGSNCLNQAVHPRPVTLEQTMRCLEPKHSIGQSIHKVMTTNYNQVRSQFPAAMMSRVGI